MRIIAGEWRGRKLVAPQGQDTRPTADRARETLFSMLASRLGGFSGLRVADLFAGSGALGFEALSRGAAGCIFVEQDRAALAAIRSNAAALGASGVDVRAQAVAGVARVAEPLDLIFIDPPYGAVDMAMLLGLLVERGWIGDRTMVSVETATGASVSADGLVLVADRRVGKAQLHLLVKG